MKLIMMMVLTCEALKAEFKGEPEYVALLLRPRW